MAATLWACKYLPHGSVSISVFFLLLCKVWANHVCPLSPSGSHRLNDLSMLAWSTHCDEERVRVKGLSRSPLMVALHHLRGLLRCVTASAEASAAVGCWSWCEEWFGSLKGFRLCSVRTVSSPVQCCSEAFVATRVAEALSCFIWCLSLTRLLLLFTSNDKTACECVSALMSALLAL